MSSHGTDLAVYAKSSTSSVMSVVVGVVCWRVVACVESVSEGQVRPSTHQERCRATVSNTLLYSSQYFREFKSFLSGKEWRLSRSTFQFFYSCHSNSMKIRTEKLLIMWNYVILLVICTHLFFLSTLSTFSQLIQGRSGQVMVSNGELLGIAARFS